MCGTYVLLKKRNVCVAMMALQSFKNVNYLNGFDPAYASYSGGQCGQRPVTGISHFHPKQKSAFALIAFGAGANRRYLLQWNENWRVYNLIGGKMDNGKGDNHSFFRTICRELEEETGLVPFKDCHVGSEMIQLEMHQYSRREKRMKEYQFAVFEVTLFPQLTLHPKQLNNAMQWLSTGRSNVVVTLEEVANLMTVGNKPISPTTHYILQELGHLGMG